MIELWGMGSPNVVKVLTALEELALPYRMTFVDVLMNEQYEPGFEALNPNRKVPVIVDPDGPGGQPMTLWESGAILMYLAEKTGRLMPADPAARYRTIQWLMFQVAGIGPMLGQHSHFRVYAKDEAHAYSRARYATEAKRLYDVVEGRLGQSRFIAGDDYTIADVATWPWLHGYANRGLEAGEIPNTVRWIAEIGERAAVRRAMAVIETRPKRDLETVLRENPDKVDRYLGGGKYSRG